GRRRAGAPGDPERGRHPERGGRHHRGPRAGDDLRERHRAVVRGERGLSRAVEGRAGAAGAGCGAREGDALRRAGGDPGGRGPPRGRAEGGVMRPMFNLPAALVLSIAAAPLARAADGHRGMLPEDYFATVAVSDPQLSPDGKRVAYTVTTVDVAKNRRQSAIWMALADGSRAPWPFTSGAVSASSPRW